MPLSAKKILVTGSNGQLGSEFKAIAASYPSIEFLFADRELLSIHDGDAVDKFFAENKITHCINCAAYTAVDKAGVDAKAAFFINATAVKYLAIACHKYDAVLVHFSTDYVFNGKASTPYKETDETDPVNLYGESKLKGEKLAFQYNENTIVIRTSWVYSSYGKNFVKTMMKLMSERENISVVADQFGSPTYAADLASAVLKLITGANQPAPGIYHYCNQGAISWFDFAMAIKEICNSTCKVNPIQTAEFPTPATRPAYSVLDTVKIQSQYNIHIPYWKDSLARCLRSFM